MNTDEDEPHAMDSDDADDPVDESEAYSTALVYETTKGKKAAHQVHHYRWRGPELINYNMDDYAAIVCVTPKKESKTELSDHRGRPQNKRYPFHPDHPLFQTHEQQLRSKPHVPLFIGRPPRPPGPRPSPLTEGWKKRARRFARYMLILLRPWRQADGQLPGSLTWKDFCDFVQQLRDGPDENGPTFIDRVTLELLHNTAQGLRVNSRDTGAAQDYRSRNATVWGQPDATSAIASVDDNGNGEGESHREYHDENERTMSKEAFEIIANLREQATVDDVVDTTTFKRLKYLNDIAEALTSMYDQLPDNGIETDATVSTTCSDSNIKDQHTVHPAVYYAEKYKVKALNLTKQLRKEPKLKETNEAEKKSSQSGKRTRLNKASSDNTQRNLPPLASKLNKEQFEIWTIYDDYFHQLIQFKNGIGVEPVPPRIFVHGGPGSGKTFLINAITETLEYYGLSQSSCALTGVASGNLPDKQTMHKTFGFKVRNKRDDVDSLTTLKNTELINLRARFNLATLALFTIDELSTISKI